MTNREATPAPEPQADRRWRDRVPGLAGRASLGGNLTTTPTEEVHDLNMAESYGLDWDEEKCGRDIYQNFFDANGGTLDGIADRVTTVHTDEDGETSLVIEGRSTYDPRYLLVLGGTSKSTGGTTAGGFGEGAKMLALALLRDHDVHTVSYRSDDWQLEFYMDDLPAEKTPVPMRGLFARITRDLPKFEGSQTTIKSKNQKVIHDLAGAREFFRSSENPDFRNCLLQKTLSDGSEVGVKFEGKERNRWDTGDELVKGRLYVAGQRRHYSHTGDPAEEWSTVEGLTIWTTKDVAPGDRDRGSLGNATLKKEVLQPLASSLTEDEVKRFIEGIETAYGDMGMWDLDDLASMVAKRGAQLDVSIEFDDKYVAAAPFMPDHLRDMLRKSGYVLCREYFSKVGMQHSNEVIKKVHEHSRVEPNPEQQIQVDILKTAVELLADYEPMKKKIAAKDIWLFSRDDENNHSHGSRDGEGVLWVAAEHLQDEFPEVLATVLHEIDHDHGTDSSAEFSYALTDTLAEIIHIVVKNPDFAKRLQEFSEHWDELRGAKKPASAEKATGMSVDSEIEARDKNRRDGYM